MDKKLISFWEKIYIDENQELKNVDKINDKVSVKN